MGILSYGQTDIGMKRATNQDSIALYPKKNAFLLADGMGGHNGGDIASGMCKDLFKSLVDKFELSSEKPTMEALICELNSAIYRHAQENPELKGMGTTITSVMIKENELNISNVGDSRAYLFKNEKIYQLTKDHSLVQEKLNIGLYTRIQANEDPQKNVLVRTVGFEPKVKVDNYKYTINKKDLFLLCSDGLHGKVSDEDISFIINSNFNGEIKQDILEKTAQQLIKQANDNGGSDNISVILIYCQ
ncbi:MAG: Stp1/IreP family PP2C-type Ser/Thr phosphatase [Bacteriovoracaceae bacterium]|jgi:protein phosphatase|nr:Stp1/IreP family PP2C-type Ser/Thr phosphatase [Bacteriovoracaceae bacterium]